MAIAAGGAAGPLHLAADSAAARHQRVDGPASPMPALTGAGNLPRWLARYRRRFTPGHPIGARASEWLLDNEYLIARAARQVVHDLPPGYRRQLPALADPAGVPRVWDLARVLLGASRLQVLGTAHDQECRIDSIAQSWAVLSGAGRAPRAEQSIAAARRQLVDEPQRLVRLLSPPFSGDLHDPGYIRAYPPGIRENGGQYTHAAVWLGWAMADLGDGNGAGRIFDLLNPILRSLTPEQAERYRVEPYVVAADIAGTAPHVGRGGWTWYTGSAAWLWRFGVERLVGLHAVDGGLQLTPCLPSHWAHVRATLETDRGTIQVTIENPSGGSAEVAEQRVDGALVRSPVIPWPGRGQTRRVEVTLRAAATAAASGTDGREAT